MTRFMATMFTTALVAAALFVSFTADAGQDDAANRGQNVVHIPTHHDFHKNVLGLFVGAAHTGRRTNATALGLEYGRRINEAFSVGLVAEHTAADNDFWVYMASLAYHFGPWKFYVAPGIEDSDLHGTEELVRLGAEYAFALSDGWEISPQLNVDILDGEDVWVVGVVLAKGF